MKLEFKGHTIYLDKEDYHFLKEIRFSVDKSKNTYYLYNSIKNIRFHRLITNCPKNKQVDHINGNGLDNRKYNLRICNNTQNKQNSNKYKNSSSKFKGVYWNKRAKKWMAQIRIKGKGTNLGLFEREWEAAKVYNYMALKYFGEYAKINEFN